jgi:hypothetical protein
MAFSATRMLMAAGFAGNVPAGYQAALFSSSNSTGSHINIPTTSLSSSGTGIISMWFNIAAIQSPNGNSLFSLTTNTGGTLACSTNPGSSPASLSLAIGSNGSPNANNTTTHLVTTNGWFNLLSSWNGGTGAFTVYVNGTGPGSVGGTVSGISIPYATTGPFIIGFFSGNASALNGCVSEFYFAPGQFLDFTNSSNRALFYNSGTPVNLGTTGQTPTGTSPAIYWKGAYNNLTNLGTIGGSFTAGGDALTNCSSAP